MSLLKTSQDQANQKFFLHESSCGSKEQVLSVSNQELQKTRTRINSVSTSNAMHTATRMRDRRNKQK